MLKAVTSRVYLKQSNPAQQMSGSHLCLPNDCTVAAVNGNTNLILKAFYGLMHGESVIGFFGFELAPHTVP